ncbi:MAG: ABC transporter substrate-binding protein [Ilumatobacteraceae bacterium]
MAGYTRRELIERSLAGAGALTIGALLLQACGSDSKSPATTGGATTTTTGGASTTAGSTSPTSAGSIPDTLTKAGLQLSWTHSVQFGGSYLALDRKYYAQEGIDITLSPGGPNVAGDAQTVSGAVLMNISAGDGVARSNEQGAKLKIVGMQYQKSPQTLLSLKDKDITKPQDLVGKRIAVSGADNPGLLAFLKTNGIEESQVTLVPSQYDPAVLTADQADAIFCFYIDLPVALEVQGIEHNTMLLADFGYNPASQTYTVLESSLTGDKRELVKQLLRAEIRGWQDYQTDYLDAAKLAVSMFPDAGLDLPTQEAQAKVQLDIMYSDVTAENGFAWFTDETVADNLKLYEQLGITGATADLFDRSLLEEIYAEGPKI